MNKMDFMKLYEERPVDWRAVMFEFKNALVHAGLNLETGEYTGTASAYELRKLALMAIGLEKVCTPV